MTLVPITMTFRNYDRVRALIDGRVKIEGCDTRYLALDIEDIFFRAIRSQDFDITELSFSSYMMMRSRGQCPYVAVPVFLSRLFRHSALYIRTDRGIKSPEDLKGKVVGVPEYQVTAALWTRGWLNDEYGVKPSDLQWRTGGEEEPGRPEKVPLQLPKEIQIARIPDHKALSPMLAEGEIDALIAPRVPSCYEKKAPHVDRMFPNFREKERAYYQKTGIFPIMHLLAIRQSLVEEHPWLPGNVYWAFDRAKNLAMEELREMGASKITLPWAIAETLETIALMGEDYWPYGVDKNIKTLQAITRHAYEQGTTARKLEIEELFHPSTLEMAKR